MSVPQGDAWSQSFEAFYRDRYTAAVKLAYALTGSASSSEDLVQEAFLRIEPRFDEIDAPVAYLRTTIVRLGIDSHRRESRRASVEHAMYQDQVVTDESREMLDVLARLEPRQRNVLVLHYWAGMTFDEIALSTGQRKGTVRSHARRGIARLRKMIGDDE